VFLPRGVWHEFWELGDEPAETIGEAEPALGAEMILATLASLAREGKADKRERPRLLQGAVIGASTATWPSLAFRLPPSNGCCCRPWPPSAGGGACALSRPPFRARRDRGHSRPLGGQPPLGRPSPSHRLTAIDNGPPVPNQLDGGAQEPAPRAVSRTAPHRPVPAKASCGSGSAGRVARHISGEGRIIRSGVSQTVRRDPDPGSDQPVRRGIAHGGRPQCPIVWVRLP